MRKSAQSWSFDIAIGTILFITVFITIFAIINADEGKKYSQVRGESELILNKIKSEDSPLQVVQDKEVNESKLSEIASIPYEQLKSEAGAKNDFCIYLEDENGNIILVNGSRGIGSSSINVSGAPCQ